MHFSDRQPTEETKVIEVIEENGNDGIRNEPEDKTNEAEADSTLKDVNLVTIYGYVRDGVLKISVYYKNREEDKSIFWKEGIVRCQCEIYAAAGKRGNRKGRKIGSIKKEI